MTVQVNIESVTRAAHAFTQSVISHQRNTSGLILMSSTLGETGTAYASTYAASKTYNTILAHGLAAELGKTVNMDVLACVPRPISTPKMANNSKAEDMAAIMQTPEQVANECFYALGQGKYSIATGPIQKVYRFVANRILPTRLPVDAWSTMFEDMTKSMPALN